jgi:hypothetical protein
MTASKGAFPGGTPSGSQPTTTFQTGQGFPNGLPPGVVFPQGQIPAEMRAKMMELMRTSQSAPVQAAPAQRVPVQAAPAPDQPVPVRAVPPPFYLIGYGQDPTAGQQATSSDQTPIPDNGTGGKRLTGRKRVQGGNAPGATSPIQGVTPQRAGSSNPVQPAPMPMGQPAPMRPKPAQGGPVINPTAPQAVAVPKPVPTRKPAVTLSARPKQTLTSFIITCRLNPQAHTLLTKSGSTPVKGSKRAPSTTTDSGRKPIGAENDTTDTSDPGGETDGNP